jgi:ATP phosphoribosyltransferase regulatory subunit
VRTEAPIPAQALEAIRSPLLATGVTRIEAPLLQPLSLLLDLAGEALRARLFVVQAEGGAEACLRPDFTVAVARQFVDDFGLSAECGWGRTEPGRLPGLLRGHRLAAEGF